MRYRRVMRDRDLALLLLLLAAATDRDRDDKSHQGVVSRVAARATGAVVDIVDPDAVIERVDVNALMERVDVNALLERVDVNALLDRIDIDRLMARVDIDAIIDQVDVQEIVERAGIPDIVQESTGALAGSALDVVRRQLVALDSIVGRAAYRLTTRDPADRPEAPPDLEAGEGVDEIGRGQVAGHYAGPVTRLLAFLADLGIVWLVFILTAVGVAFLIELFSPLELDDSGRRSLIGFTAFALWAFLYSWFSLALAGKTPGMAIVGLAVVTREGKPISGRQAALRTLVFPFSFLIFGLGFLGILVSPQRRAMHDAAAGTVVVYHWGEREAEMPAPFTQWLNRHAADDE